MEEKIWGREIFIKNLFINISIILLYMPLFLIFTSQVELIIFINLNHYHIAGSILVSYLYSYS